MSAVAKSLVFSGILLAVVVPHTAYPDVIPLKSEGGTFVVPVLINDKLTLDFTLDSGAADVSIPLDVFSTLERTRTVSESDLLPSAEYILADGGTRRENRFRLRSLKIGNLELRDVVGSVGPPRGPLLLGQSFLSRLRNWSVDNQIHVLIINEGTNTGYAAQPAAAGNTDAWRAGSVAEFRGHYACGQGLTALTILIVAASTGTATTAEFRFGPTTMNPSVPEGAFKVEGRVDLSGGRMSLHPVEWIDRPYRYEMVGLDGSSEDGGHSFSGYIVGGWRCSSFSVTRMR
jgi:gag-polyprotein putative aspartyl protease